MGRTGLLLVVVSIAVLAGCAAAPSTEPPAAATPIPLDGTSWVAVSINDTNTVLGAMPTLAFDGDRVSGSTGCNTFGGTVVSEADGRVRFVDVVMTEIACADPIGAQEAAFLAILGAPAELAVDEGMLFLTTASGRVTFEGRAGG
ncbi:MAG TPA: META domain-containing protein [Candidatus Limnocylindrales bacterium]|nr:META domain-containing protein [Candidatus Limnocylindrales bacterium]